MSAPEHMSEMAKKVWDEMEEIFTPAPGFEAYCNQLAIERDAGARIAAEGLIVADSKGQPVPHPALEIQRRAQVEIRAWSGKFRKRF